MPRTFLYLAICLALIAYFAWHAIHGRHGLEAKAQLEARVQTQEAELASLKAERLRIERDIAGMTAGAGSNRDLIEEQARALMNFVQPTDIVLVKPPAATN